MRKKTTTKKQQPGRSGARRSELEEYEKRVLELRARRQSLSSSYDLFLVGARRAAEVGNLAGIYDALVYCMKKDADVKRRRDVALDDVRLYGPLRDCLVRRVMPAILQAFQSRIVRIEAPRIGCYDAATGGWFRCHRDNTTAYTAHRQFALSLNLNAGDEYDGGELRFREFGRQLYRPAAGGGLVFSCSLLHEVMPVTRGRRFGVFTFLHDEGHDAQYRRLIAEARARGVTGVRMRDPKAH